jgi:hypothetical protein
MPAVSTRIRSKPAACSTRIASRSPPESARCARRVASERTNTPGAAIAFRRMRSPSSAPPERRRVGSMSRIPSERSGKSRCSRRTSSSSTLDLPEPPVPVSPITGAGSARRCMSSPRRRCSSDPSLAAPSSNHEIRRATAPGSLGESRLSSSPRSSRRTEAHSARISWIIPWRPSCRPSSGRKIRETP